MGRYPFSSITKSSLQVLEFYGLFFTEHHEIHLQAPVEIVSEVPKKCGWNVDLWFLWSFSSQTLNTHGERQLWKHLQLAVSTLLRHVFFKWWIILPNLFRRKKHPKPHLLIKPPSTLEIWPLKRHESYVFSELQEIELQNFNVSHLRFPPKNLQ